MAPAERRALLTLLCLGVAGQGLRLIVGRPDEPPGQVALLPVERRGSPAAHRDSALAATRPLAPGETLDPDGASVQELLRLPRVGPALARAIAADRAARGPFGSLEGLDRVAGIGPSLLAALRPYLRFRTTAPAIVPTSPASSCPAPAPCLPDLNRMTVAELEALPGIGPALALRIVAYRDSHGPFADIGALLAIPGIGPALVARLRTVAATREHAIGQ